jgi:hypothetical protein
LISSYYLCDAIKPKQTTMERIKLKNIKYSASFSEETNAFTADIFFDNKKVGYCVNRGSGGPTDCNLWDASKKEAFAQMKEYCNGLGIEAYGDKLEYVVDDLFQNWLTAKTIKKDEKKGILFGDTSRYSIQTFISLGERVGKRVSMADVLKTESGVKVVKDFCLKVKKEGHNILNTNLPFAV